MKNHWLDNRFHHGFSFWIYGLMCFILLVFIWKVVPETKGKSLEEIERLWAEPVRSLSRYAPSG